MLLSFAYAILTIFLLIKFTLAPMSILNRKSERIILDHSRFTSLSHISFILLACFRSWPERYFRINGISSGGRSSSKFDAFIFIWLEYLSIRKYSSSLQTTIRLTFLGRIFLRYL